MRPVLQHRPRLCTFLVLLPLCVTACSGSDPQAHTTLHANPNPPPSASPDPATTTAAPPPSAPASPAKAPEPPPPAPRAAWSLKSPGKTAQLIDVQDGRVFAFAGDYLEFGSPTRHLLSIDAASGKVLWSKDLGEGLYPEALIADGVVALRSNENKKVILYAATGTPAFKAPAKAADMALSLDCKHERGELACKDPKSGAESFRIPVPETIGALTQPPGLVCFARAIVLTIECRDAKTGAAKFRHVVPRVPDVKEPDAIHFSYRVVEGRLYVANYDGTLAGLDFDR